MEKPENEATDSTSGAYLHRKTDLESICQQQKDEIVSLQSKIREKDRQLDELTKILRKYASIIPELKAINRKTKGEEETDGEKPGFGVDFWDSNVERGETTVNFEEIASKGLWIMSSSVQPPILDPKSHQNRSKIAGNHKRTESVPINAPEEVESTPGRRNFRLKQLIRPAGPVKRPGINGESTIFSSETDRSLKKSPEMLSKPVSNASFAGKSEFEPGLKRGFHRKLPSLVGPK